MIYNLIKFIIWKNRKKVYLKKKELIYNENKIK
jgi:hypothetical protein